MLGRTVVRLFALLGPLACGGCLITVLASEGMQSGASAKQSSSTTQHEAYAAKGSTAPQASRNEYVDASVCAGCHQQIYDEFKKTGMGRSFYRPEPAKMVEDFKEKNHYYSALSDTHYAMVERDGAYFQRRWQVGLNGVETNVEEMKVDYVLGSGDQARSYLHRTERDTLIELPLGWYSEKGGYWAMSPGFDSKHPQTRRLVSYECTFCHTGYPQLSDEARAQNVDPVFKGKMTEGIDCQRCHGPGGQHVAVVKSAHPTLEAFRSTIVNPAKLPPKRQLEVCMECHLEPTSGHLPSIIRKFDRDPFSYVAGQPLEDFTRYFDYPAGKGYDDRFEIVSAAYRLRKSRCFLESQGAMTCLNCHDPHRGLPTGEEAVTFYAKACDKCHAPALAEKVAAGKHPASQDCVSCHMPKRRTEDVVHVVVTDHYIQRKLPQRDLLAELTEVHRPESEEYHGEVVPYYPAQPAPTGENRLYGAVAQVLLQNNLAQGAEQLQREVSQQQGLRAEFYTTLGDAWMNSKQPEKAATAYRQALQRNAKSLVAMQGLARSQQQMGDDAASAAILERALKVSPLEPNTWYQYALLEAQRGRREDALVKVNKALELSPDLSEGYFNLANLLVQTGRAQEAGPALKKALAIDPYDAAAYDLSGQVAAMERNLPESLYAFEKAVKLRAGYPPYLYDYGLALVQAGRYDEAKLQMQAALAVDPQYAEAHEILGALYVREKQPGQAITEYRAAIASRPEMNRVHLNLGLLLIAQGNRAEAIEHLQRAASDANPAVAGPAAQALQQLGAK